MGINEVSGKVAGVAHRKIKSRAAAGRVALGYFTLAVLAERLDTVPSPSRKLYRVGPNCEAWPNSLTGNPY